MYAKCLSLTAAIAFFGLFAIGSAWAQIPEGCPAPVPQSLDSSQPPNLSLIKPLLYYRCTKYDSEVEKKLTEARGWIEMRAPQVSKPAIVLDIDETALSNWTRIKKDDFAFFLGWHLRPHEENRSMRRASLGKACASPCA
jgi:acid phosphatase